MNLLKVHPFPRRHQGLPLLFGERSRTRGTKDAYPLTLPLSTRGLIFVNDDQKSKYESLTVRMTSE